MTGLSHPGTWLLTLLVAATAGQTAGAEEQSQNAALEAMVEADWEAQERRRGRAPHAPEAIRDALAAADRLLDDLRGMPDAPDLGPEAAALWALRREAGQIDSMGPNARLALYRKIRGSARRLALKNPLIASRPLVFLKRRRFICQMLHEYLGYYYDYDDVAGGGVYLLENPGCSLQVRDLIRHRLPRGNYTTLAVSFDAKTVYFAFAERAPEKPDYHSPERRSFHLFAVGADGDNLRQLTRGPNDDFDPCPLPDGGVAFMSTRRGGFGRCHNPWEPLPSYTLHRVDATGENVRTLSFHETNEWHPSVLEPPRRRRCRHTVWQLHDADQRLLSAQGDSRVEPGHVRRRRPSCGGGRVAGDRRSGPRRPRCGKRRRSVRLARDRHARSLFSRSARLAEQLLPRPLAPVGGLFPGRVQLCPAAGHGAEGQGRHADGPLPPRSLRQHGVTLSGRGYFVHVPRSARAAAGAAGRAEDRRPESGERG
ncbi:MAG: TolB family protein [Planctomycetota bacterium]